jgi:uncharacterized protein (TIGR02145 family)
VANLGTYGRLYNWYAVNTGNLCPTGWHVPTDEEYTTLTDGLGGTSVAGDPMKSSASDSPAWNGTNTSGFSGLAGGGRAVDGVFEGEGQGGIWWSASPDGSNAWTRILADPIPFVTRDNSASQLVGSSVRCVQDNVDDVIPTITSGATGTDLAENSGAGQTIYTITADANDGGTIQSFAIGGSDFDANLLSVNASTGVVTLTADPDYETQSSYSFTVTATDEAGTSNATTVTFSITDVDESLAFVNCGDPYTYENHSYATVLIGTQCWFAENLRSENYNTGTAIATELDDATWSTTTDGAVTVYDEGGANAVANLGTYGRLYNWYAVNTGNLCPTGWHVPTDGEWTTLTDGIGDVSVAGHAMKSSASDSPAWNGTNSSDFSGLPGGDRHNNGDFENEGAGGIFWSASPDGWYRILISGSSVIRDNAATQRHGFSVRCVQD